MSTNSPPASNPPASRGAAIGAVWIIGVGIVLLVQQLTDWPWTQAWPLWLVLVGVASLATTLIGRRSGGRWLVDLGWPLILTALGVILLLSTTGVLGLDAWELITQWWPLVLILLGLWFLVFALFPRAQPAGSINHVSVPLAGVEDAWVKVRFGGGELNAGPAPPGIALSGAFEAAPARLREVGAGRWELEPESWMNWGWSGGAARWQIGLTTEVPLELELEVGAAKTRVDLAETRLRRLRIGTGASDTRVRLPKEAGETFVRAEGGAASITFEVPSGVAARVRSRMTLGSTHVDSQFPQTADGWESPDWGTATNRVEIEIQGGVGSASVVAA
ncbi:MAG TPA: DUF5668 domain-containing protein [Candidatus Limnocylindria bacterium]